MDCVATASSFLCCKGRTHFRFDLGHLGLPFDACYRARSSFHPRSLGLTHTLMQRLNCSFPELSNGIVGPTPRRWISKFNVGLSLTQITAEVPIPPENKKDLIMMTKIQRFFMIIWCESGELAKSATASPQSVSPLSVQGISK